METIDDEEYDRKFSQLKTAIDQNPFGYDSYVEIINLLRKQGEFNLLREYRNKMKELFPLTESKKSIN